ncbi:hypothetical protein D3C81_1897580 [compost metagenome]
MGIIHKLTELLQVVLLQHFDGIEHALVLFHNMAGAASDGFVYDFIFVYFELFGFHLRQVRQGRNLLLQNRQGLIALTAALIVFGVHKASLLVGVADYQLVGAGHKRN